MPSSFSARRRAALHQRQHGDAVVERVNDGLGQRCARPASTSSQPTSTARPRLRARPAVGEIAVDHRHGLSCLRQQVCETTDRRRAAGAARRAGHADQAATRGVGGQDGLYERRPLRLCRVVNASATAGQRNWSTSSAGRNRPSTGGVAGANVDKGRRSPTAERGPGAGFAITRKCGPAGADRLACRSAQRRRSSGRTMAATLRDAGARRLVVGFVGADERPVDCAHGAILSCLAGRVRSVRRRRGSFGTAARPTKHRASRSGERERRIGRGRVKVRVRRRRDRLVGDDVDADLSNDGLAAAAGLDRGPFRRGLVGFDGALEA